MASAARESAGFLTRFWDGSCLALSLYNPAYRPPATYHIEKIKEIEMEIRPI